MKGMGVGHDEKQIRRLELKEISRLEVKMAYRQKNQKGQRYKKFLIKWGDNEQKCVNQKHNDG